MLHSPFEFRTHLEEQLTAWNLPAELAAQIEEHSTPANFERGAIVFVRGAPADLFFWLRKGFVKIYLPHGEGNRTLVAIARPGDPLGMVATVNGNRHQIFEAQALTKCSVGLLSREQMMNLVRKLNRERPIQLIGDLNSTCSALFERCAKFVGLPFRERLEMVFEDLGTRFGVDDERGTLIILKLGQEDLAEMIGSSRPIVSKLLSDMVEEGSLTRGEERQFILPNQAKRRTKLTPSPEVTRSSSAVSASKSPARTAVRLSTQAGGDLSRVALSAMNYSSGRHNV
jgi:CRP/FNR family cyclic AMP-dependent transcriptional regulator